MGLTSTNSQALTPTLALKVLVIGDNHTGKSTLIKTFINNGNEVMVDYGHVPLSQINSVKTIEMSGYYVELTLNEASRQDAKKSNQESYDMIVFCFDLTEKKTILTLSELINTMLIKNNKCVYALIGNKKDIWDETSTNQVTTHDAYNLSNALSIRYQKQHTGVYFNSNHNERFNVTQLMFQMLSYQHIYLKDNPTPTKEAVIKQNEEDINTTVAQFMEAYQKIPKTPFSRSNINEHSNLTHIVHNAYRTDKTTRCHQLFQDVGWMSHHNELTAVAPKCVKDAYQKLIADKVDFSKKPVSKC